MKTHLLLFAVSFASILASQAAHPQSKPEPVPTYDNSDIERLEKMSAYPWLCTSRERLGPFELTDLAGRKWADRELKGKVVIAVLWTRWCGFCIQELSAVQKLHENTRQDKEIVLLTLNLDEDPSIVAPFARQRGYDFPVLLARSMFKEPPPDKLPINWLVDREGVIRKEVCGYGHGLIEFLHKDALALKEGARLTPGYEKERPGR
jgi:thiol-disulfide isomerase/thioredoxin